MAFTSRTLNTIHTTSVRLLMAMGLVGVGSTIMVIKNLRVEDDTAPTDKQKTSK